MTSKKSIILFAIFFILYEFNTYISNDMIMPGMLTVVKEFNAPIADVAKSLSLFVIGGSTLQIFLGPLCDKFGKRNILLCGNLLFLIASIIIPFSNNITHFLQARFFQGMGLCFIFIGYATVHELFNDKEAIKLNTFISNVSVFAPLIGPVLGSAIITSFKWRDVFIITAILAIVTLLGLAKYMPNDKPKISQNINIYQIIKIYKKILFTRVFLQGGLILAIAILPMLAWIGLSPVLIMEVLHKPFVDYIIYQSIVFGGFIISSVAIQFLAGRYSFYKLITRGTSISLIGFTISCLLYNNPYDLFILGLFIASLGIGIFTGSIFRLAITSTKQSNSMSAAALSIVQSLIMAGGLEVLNRICNLFHYSILSFTILNLICSLLTLILGWNFAKLLKDRQWQ